MKMDESVLEENHILRCCGCLSFLNSWGAHIVSIVKTALKKIGAMVHSMKFLSLDVDSINPRYSHAWITFVMLLLAATLNF